MLSIHSRAACTRLYTTGSPLLAGGHGTASQRCADIIHSQHTLANAKLQGAKCTRKGLSHFVFPPCLWFVNTSVALEQLPGLYLITIKHLHEKVDKGRNSGGGLTTKRPIYSVQSSREREREGRRRSWEESWINELKMSWNSGCLNTFGFI